MIELPPPLILPAHFEGNRPAIIRPAIDLARYFPVQISRGERRAILAELRRAGRVEAMLPGMVPVIAGARAPATSTWLGSASSGTDLSSYNFSAINLDPAVGLKVLVAVAEANASGGVTGVTVGGNAATKVFDPVAVAGLGVNAPTLWLADYPTDTGDTISITLSGTTARCAIGAWAVDDLQSSTFRDYIAQEGVTSPTGTIDCPAGGFIIGVWSNHSSGGNATSSWTGITERADIDVEGGRYTSFASDNFAAEQVARTITDTTAGSNVGRFVVVSFR